jgi:hypothetical protein
MSKQSWFEEFERQLAERGWYDDPNDFDYEEAGKAAWDKILNREPPEKENE